MAKKLHVPPGLPPAATLCGDECVDNGIAVDHEDRSEQKQVLCRGRAMGYAMLGSRYHDHACNEGGRDESALHDVAVVELPSPRKYRRKQDRDARALGDELLPEHLYLAVLKKIQL